MTQPLFLNIFSLNFYHYGNTAMLPSSVGFCVSLLQNYQQQLISDLRCLDMPLHNKLSLFRTRNPILSQFFQNILPRNIGEHTKPSTGDFAIIWNSSASHPLLLNTRGLLKGRSREWGNRKVPFYHADTSKLFDRDYVWFVTQTMVSINWTLWASYKVFPKSFSHH